MIDEDRFQEAVDADEGWCVSCKDFTRESTEPSTKKHNCPECNENTVLAAEQALLMGEVEVS